MKLTFEKEHIKIEFHENEDNNYEVDLNSLNNETLYKLILECINNKEKLEIVKVNEIGEYQSKIYDIFIDEFKNN